MGKPPVHSVRVATRIEGLITFFAYEFCPNMLDLLHYRRAVGLNDDEVRVVGDFIANARHRAVILGDTWFPNLLRGELSVQRRIGRIQSNFRSWCAISGRGPGAELERTRVYERLTGQVGRLSRAYRSNTYIIAQDIDLKQIEKDYKYYDSLRSLGIGALKDAVSAVLIEILGGSRRSPSIIERKKKDPDDTESIKQE